jgi:hypothetical protein
MERVNCELASYNLNEKCFYQSLLLSSFLEWFSIKVIQPFSTVFSNWMMTHYSTSPQILKEYEQKIKQIDKKVGFVF